jgi:hypothetical protein
MSTSSSSHSIEISTGKDTPTQVAHPAVMADLSALPINARPIRSFALRGGHMSEAQKRAYNAGMPKWSIGFDPIVTDFNRHFPKPAPLVLEIGCSQKTILLALRFIPAALAACSNSLNKIL